MTRTAWRACHPDLRSSHGYRWPFPGNEAVPPLPDGAEQLARLSGGTGEAVQHQRARREQSGLCAQRRRRARFSRIFRCRSISSGDRGSPIVRSARGMKHSQ